MIYEITRRILLDGTIDVLSSLPVPGSYPEEVSEVRDHRRRLALDKGRGMQIGVSPAVTGTDEGYCCIWPDGTVIDVAFTIV